jgi:hypothetical protein
MILQDTNNPEMSFEIKIAVLITILIGICVAIGIFVLDVQAERYSSVYLNPDSYTNYMSDTPISFVYGIHSYEKQSTDYMIEIHAGTSIVETKKVSLMPGEIYEERKIVQIPEGAEFPIKISVQTTSPYETNEVHFWVKNSTVSG